MKMTEFTKGYLIGFLVGVVCMIICATTHDYLENAEKKYDSITAHITTQQEAKKLAENFSKQCTELELKLSHFMTDEELSFMNANPKSRLELAEENQQLKKSSVIYETSILTGTWNISAKLLWKF